MRPVRVAAARTLIAGALALGLAACEDGGNPAPSQGPLSASDLQQFTCSDWRSSNPQERRRAVDQLREITGGAVVGGRGVRGRGTVLEDDDAYRLFDGHCRHDHAADFVLYKLYGQAAGFAGVAP